MYFINTLMKINKYCILDVFRQQTAINYAYFFGLALFRFDSYGSGRGGGGAGRGGGGGGFSGRGDLQRNALGDGLNRPRWDMNQLKPFEKHFYQEHSSVTNRPMVSTSESGL